MVSPLAITSPNPSSPPPSVQRQHQVELGKATAAYAAYIAAVPRERRVPGLKEHPAVSALVFGAMR